MGGVAVAAGPHDGTWDILDRFPDKFRKDGSRIEGSPRPTIANVVRVLSHDPRWSDPEAGAYRVQLNTFSGDIEIDGEPRTDTDEVSLAVWLDSHYTMRVTPRQVSDASALVAKGQSYHPVREYLEALTWDGDPRCHRLGPDYFGSDDTPLAEELGLRFLISAVARVMRPGCKVDTTVVIVGPQGARKSTGVRALAVNPGWYSSTPFVFGNKDAYQGLPGVWIYELAELATMRPSTVDATKAFLSARVDRFRPSYGRNFVRVPRQTVFVGTVNEMAFLHDPTGARRFWPLRVQRVNLEAIVADRDQLWAEALHRFNMQEPWWLDEQRWGAVLEEDQARHQSGDPWEGPVVEWLRTHPAQFVTVADILSSALRMDCDRQTKSASMRLGRIIERTAWSPARRRVNGERVRGYERS